MPKKNDELFNIIKFLSNLLLSLFRLKWNLQFKDLKNLILQIHQINKANLRVLLLLTTNGLYPKKTKVYTQ